MLLFFGWIVLVLLADYKTINASQNIEEIRGIETEALFELNRLKIRDFNISESSDFYPDYFWLEFSVTNRTFSIQFVTREKKSDKNLTNFSVNFSKSFKAFRTNINGQDLTRFSNTQATLFLKQSNYQRCKHEEFDQRNYSINLFNIFNIDLTARIDGKIVLRINWDFPNARHLARLGEFLRTFPLLAS